MTANRRKSSKSVRANDEYRVEDAKPDCHCG